MKRLKRPACRALAVALCGSAAMAAAASSVSATSDGIARPPGAIDKRAYELVSIPDKGKAQIGVVSLPSLNGNRVLYDVLGAVKGSPVGSRAKLVANRTDSGWVSSVMLPGLAEMPGRNYLYGATTPDLGNTVMTAFDGLGTGDGSPNMSVVRLDTAGHQTLLHTFPVFYGAGADLVASDNLAHVYTNAPEPIDPSHQADTSNVYDIGSGVPVLVSRLPSTGNAPTCGVPRGQSNVVGFADANSADTEHWISADGSRALFLSAGDDAPDCDDPLQLYVRDNHGTPATGDDDTTLISGPPVGGDPDLGIQRFLQATADGSEVFFRTATSLAADDDTDANSSDSDVYRWTAASGSVCLTCGIPSANVLGDSITQVPAVSEDGSHVYFASTVAFDGAAVATNGAPNLYVWHGGQINFIVRTNGVTSRVLVGGQVTPDGNVLIFRTARVELNAIDGNNGGRQQYYRYDDTTKAITCLSCPPGGAPATAAVPLGLTGGFQSVITHMRAVSDDGSIVAFRSTDALVPEDVNAAPDIYEWHDGTRKLITNGVNQYPTFTPSNPNGPTLASLSAGGRDLLFVDSARLTFDAQDDAKKVYDARVDGGFAAPILPKPACDGESCHGLSSSPPTFVPPGSLTLMGEGNVKPPRPPRFSVAHIARAQRTRFADTGRIMLSVQVSGRGRVSAFAQAMLGRIRQVAHTSRTTHGPGQLTLRMRLSSVARAQLESTGRLRLTLGVSYSKVPVVKRISLQLKATPNAR